MKDSINKQNCTKENKNDEEFKVSVVFNENGESFQNIMEKLLISKLINGKNNE